MLKDSKVGLTKQQELTILLVILVVGSILRFWNYSEIPYTYDEFSALFRTDFTNFKDLIEEGVKVDYHPAGVQVFMTLWVKLFGTTEWIVKLPFTLLGIVSIYLTYLIGKKWFQASTGLLTALFIATSQYDIMYSVIARPYVTGFFFSLLLVNALTNLIYQPKNNLKNWITFIIAGTFCAYNHHVSMLFAGLVGIVGLFLIDKSIRKFYLISGSIIGILYLPHLPILLHQLAKGGVGGQDGWLKAPNGDFFWNYFFYLNHYSWIIVGIVLLIFAISNYFTISVNKNKKWFYSSILLFILPLLITYFYSVYGNPILQFSVLIFSHAFLYFILFSKFNLPFKFLFPLLLIIGVLIIFTLQQNRKHFTLFYQSPYEEIVLEANEAQKDGIPLLIYSDKRITEFYEKKHGIKLEYINQEDFSQENQLWSSLDSVYRHNQLLFVGVINSNPPYTLAFVNQFYGEKKAINDYFGGSTFIYSTSNKLEHSKTENLTAEEYSGMISIPIETMIEHKMDFIDCIADVSVLDSAFINLHLVSEIRLGDSLYHWSAGKLSQTYIANQDNQHVLINSLKLADIDFPKEAELRVYFWNPDKLPFQSSTIRITKRKGNRMLYGIYDPF